MTKSIRKSQKSLRKKAKPQSPHAQSQKYWPRQMRDAQRQQEEMFNQERIDRMIEKHLESRQYFVD